MTAPSTLITQTQPESPNKERVEAHLRKLQDSNRLAMHMKENIASVTEEHFRRMQPILSPSRNGGVDTRHLLGHNDTLGAQTIHDRINAGSTTDIAVFAASLLAPSSCGAAVAPYAHHEGDFYKTGYLIDLSASDAQPIRPRVLRVCHEILDSGLDLFNKGGVDRNLMSAKDGIAKADRQLDTMIADHYLFRQHGPGLDTNEILVACGMQHVAAIAVPSRDNDIGYKPWLPYARNLMGALEGLEHLNHGIDLPVVLYHHRGGPHHGAITYLGQGRQELTEIALDALEKCYGRVEETSFPQRITYRERIEKVLGLDPGLPPSQQPQAVAALRAKCNASTQEQCR